MIKKIIKTKKGYHALYSHPQCSVVTFDVFQVHSSFIGTNMEEQQGIVVWGPDKPYQLFHNITDSSPWEAKILPRKVSHVNRWGPSPPAAVSHLCPLPSSCRVWFQLQLYYCVTPFSISYTRQLLHTRPSPYSPDTTAALGLQSPFRTPAWVKASGVTRKVVPLGAGGVPWHITPLWSPAMLIPVEILTSA